MQTGESSEAIEQSSEVTTQSTSSNPASTGGSFADVINEGVLNTGESTGESANEPQYYYADGVPGKGNRPDYLIEKYKTVEEQAKAYKNSLQIIGRAKQLESIIGAPEQYEIPDNLKENPNVVKLAEMSKKYGFNQEFFNESLGFFKEAQEKALANRQAEVAKLGDNAEERVKITSQWVKNNFKPEVFNALKSIPFKAEVFEFFEGVKSMTTQTSVPNANATQAQADTIASIKEEMRANHDKVRNDPQYARQVMERLNKAGGHVIERR
jgi:hypothetical protein